MRRGYNNHPFLKKKIQLIEVATWKKKQRVMLKYPINKSGTIRRKK